MVEKYIPLNEPSCYILLSLFESAKHGYAIIQDIKKLTNGSLSMGNGTLYGILKRMTEDGIIETSKLDDKKTYYITDEGKKVLELELGRLNRLVANFKNLNIKER